MRELRLHGLGEDVVDELAQHVREAADKGQRNRERRADAGARTCQDGERGGDAGGRTAIGRNSRTDGERAQKDDLERRTNDRACSNVAEHQADQRSLDDRPIEHAVAEEVIHLAQAYHQASKQCRNKH